jgi:hypothetical protein
MKQFDYSSADLKLGVKKLPQYLNEFKISKENEDKCIIIDKACYIKYFKILYFKYQN